MNLGELAEVQMGYPFRSRLEHDPEGDVTVIQMKDIDDANLLHAEEAIRVALPKGKTHHLLRAGDLLFRSRGRSNGAAQVLDGISPAVLAAPMLLIRPHKVLPAYLCWYINTPTTQAQLATQAEGTSVRMISAEALKSLEVPLPSVATQRSIVQAAALAEQEQTLLARIATLRQRMTTHTLMKLAQPSSERPIP
jgi:Type I restriction modification DNA specificity domain